jgi:hypothetical protein
MIHILKRGALFLLMSIVIVGAIASNRLIALATTGPQGDCGNSITVDNTPAGASASCLMGVSSNFGSGFLAFTNDTNATTSTAVTGTNAFTFGTTIVDLRNTNAGWRLEAASPGLTNTAGGISSTIPINFTTSTTTCIPTDGDAADCVIPTSHAITLSPASQYYLSTGPIAGGSIISATFNATTNATYTFTGTEPAGTYTGDITIALVNAF